MPQSFSAIFLHIVFSTKNRVALIDDELAARLYPNFGGIANLHGSLLSVGGMPDHVHLLVSLDRNSSIRDLLRDLKANSSKWIHETFPERNRFAWQSG